MIFWSLKASARSVRKDHAAVSKGPRRMCVRQCLVNRRRSHVVMRTSGITQGMGYEQTAFNFFAAKGLTELQSAGVVGNLIQESSMNPGAVEFGGGPGRGIAQWS